MKTKKSPGLKNKTVFVRAKKALGQNFLKSEIALKKIIEAGNIRPDDVILEIGPGKGVLTKKLLEKSGLVIAVEKDRELFEFLGEKFAKEIAEKKLILVNEDILNFNLKQDIALQNIAQRDGASIAIRQQANMRVEQNNILRSYKIIANIPYNITGAILKKFLTGKNQPASMVLMVQHEVAKRIIARNPRHGGAGGKESILSISVKAYGEPKLIMKVPARYFSPAPKVDSAVIAINNISRKTFIENNINEEKFWEIVKAGFAHKRKKLNGNLRSLFGNNSLKILTSAGIKENARAEDVSLKEWLTIMTEKEKTPLWE
ncbi:MAG: 16S rRNA (adenine(1518)-N(6)/adenine(1519)-N(6))-dimethyltransferase RsmA [Candidatus Paceibacterota bacterium]|jgi:16S rRNA (adenine1518-N6/adenine1519-N6)-dimethyltransferase